MKKLLAVAILVVLTVVGVPRADAGVGGYLGYWDADQLGDGWGIGGKVDYSFLPLISLEGRATYYWLGGSVNALPIEAVGLVNFGMLYGGVSLGWWFIDQNVENSFGGSILGGVKLNLVAVEGFAELNYTYLDTKDKDTGLDLKGSGIGFKVGATLGLF